MWKLFGSKRKNNKRPNWGRITYVALIAVGLLLIVGASRNLIVDEREYSAARQEYEQLRENYPVIAEYLPTTQQPASLTDTDADAETLTQTPEKGPETIPNQQSAEQPQVLGSLTVLNPDFVGWIVIDGVIDYPVVRGRDNNGYLRVTFSGQRNSSGTIFMDYRNSQGFSGDVCIVYGHNMRDGSMFAPLKKYREKRFMEAHPNINIVTSDGDILSYRVFATKMTDAWDDAYTCSFADCMAVAKSSGRIPEDVSRFLILSTCTNSSDKDDRLLVYAALTT